MVANCSCFFFFFFFFFFFLLFHVQLCCYLKVVLSCSLSLVLLGVGSLDFIQEIVWIEQYHY